MSSSPLAGPKLSDPVTVRGQNDRANSANRLPSPIKTDDLRSLGVTFVFSGYTIHLGTASGNLRWQIRSPHGVQARSYPE